MRANEEKGYLQRGKYEKLYNSKVRGKEKSSRSPYASRAIGQKPKGSAHVKKKLAEISSAKKKLKRERRKFVG